MSHFCSFCSILWASRAWRSGHTFYWIRSSVMSSYIFKENSEGTHWNKQWESYKLMARLESLNQDVKTEICLASSSFSWKNILFLTWDLLYLVVSASKNTNIVPLALPNFKNIYPPISEQEILTLIKIIMVKSSILPTLTKHVPPSFFPLPLCLMHSLNISKYVLTYSYF